MAEQQQLYTGGQQQQQQQQQQHVAQTAGAGKDQHGDDILSQEIDRIIERLDAAIPEAQKSMDELLSRLRSTRIAA